MRGYSENIIGMLRRRYLLCDEWNKRFAVGEKLRKAFFSPVRMYAANEAAEDSIVVHVVLVVSCLGSFSHQLQKKSTDRP